MTGSSRRRDNEWPDLDPAPYRSALLDLYRARARDLPWRRDRDPYRVWVSEVMLQQTRVQTAIPYYERWLERFPTLESLAEAPIDDVLREWAGLGYYRRARYLHRAAGIVRERHGGRLPSDPDALRELPGIGDYTAGAIASIAFGLPEPAVDGNVRRVLSRLLDLPDPGAAELRRIAATLVPDDHPGEFNQALMEFGSTVCTPRSPSCSDCPLTEHCLAHAAGTQHERPRPKRTKPVPEIDVGTAVLVDPDGRFLLRRRPESGLLGGMWEFPGAEAEAESKAEKAARNAARSALADSDLHVVPGTALPLGTIDHAFSHLRVRYHAFRLDVAPDAIDPEADGPCAGHASITHSGAEVRWVPHDELDQWALPAAQRRIEHAAGTLKNTVSG